MSPIVYEAKKLFPTNVISGKRVPPCQLGEGPVWDYRFNRLTWVDILKCTLHCYDATTNRLDSFYWTAQVSKDAFGEPSAYLSFAIPCTEPQVFVCGCEHGVFLWNLRGAAGMEGGAAGGCGAHDHNPHTPHSPNTTMARALYRFPKAAASSSPSQLPNTTSLAATDDGDTVAAAAALASSSSQQQHTQQQQQRQRINDAKVDPLGRLFFGTMDVRETEPLGHMYRGLPPTASQLSRAAVNRVHGSELGVVESPMSIFGDLTISNGIDWSPSFRTIYFVDSPSRRIFSLPYDAESGLPRPNTHRRVLWEVAEGSGYPDGICVDEIGMLWVALWSGGRVLRICPRTRSVVAEVVVPRVKRVTSVAFGGPKLSRLFITTAVSNDPNANPDLGEEDHAGHVFVADVGVCGQPFHYYPLPPAADQQASNGEGPWMMLSKL